MAFPVVETRATSTTTSNQTSHTVNLPTGITAGDLLIVAFGCDATPGVVWAGGWSRLSNSDGGQAMRLVVECRQADGTEGASITVTTGTTQHAAAVAWRISGAEAIATQLPEVSSATGTLGDSANPDPPSLTPTGGAKDYLWIAVNVADGGRASTAAPTNYSNLQAPDSGGTADGVGTGTAERSLNVASEDPGTFTIDAIDQWVTQTIVVHPTAAGGGTTFTITPAGTVSSAGAMVKDTSKGFGGTVASSGAAIKDTSKGLTGSIASAGALAKAIAKPFSGTVTSSGALETTKVVLLNLAGTITSAGTLIKDTSKGLAGALTPSGALAKAISKPFAGTVSSAGSLVTSVFETLRRWLFTPPTHEVVAWETGRDDKGRRADPTWRHYDRGDRGKTVVRTNGEYATYTNPLYTVLENADQIRQPDGTIGPAVFLGGHITEVTKAIKDELVAAGYTVESEEVV